MFKLGELILYLSMRKLMFTACLTLLCALFLSFGFVGHRSVGKIAENNLTPTAKAAVQDLLGKETLAGVSTWADEVRTQPEYKSTASWHFLNLPLGLNYIEFERQIEGMNNSNVYSALVKAEHDLINPSISKERKIEALKFVVHFVGDMHQPMHISRSEDKGGNTIQLNYNGKGTNLHSLWDSKLVERQGLAFEQIADSAKPSSKQIAQWQQEPQLKWAWESYQISSKLYAEVDLMKSRSINEEYYKKHMPVINQRIQQAGFRLAAVLNEIFKGGRISSALIPPRLL
jgi:hypothetical protein